MPAVSTCQQCQHASSVNMPTVSTCQQCQHASSVNMPAVSTCQQCQHASSVNMPAVSTCQQCQHASSVNMPAVSTCQQCHPKLSACAGDCVASVHVVLPVLFATLMRPRRNISFNLGFILKFFAPPVTEIKRFGASRCQTSFSRVNIVSILCK